MRCLEMAGERKEMKVKRYSTIRAPLEKKMDFVKLHEEFTKKANDALPYLLELLKSKENEVPVSLRVFKDDFRKQLFEMIKRGGLKSPKLKPKSKNHFFLRVLPILSRSSMVSATSGSKCASINSNFLSPAKYRYI